MPWLICARYFVLWRSREWWTWPRKPTFALSPSWLKTRRDDPHFFHQLPHPVVVATTMEDLTAKTSSTLIPGLPNVSVVSHVIETVCKNVDTEVLRSLRLLNKTWKFSIEKMPIWKGLLHLQKKLHYISPSSLDKHVQIVLKILDFWKISYKFRCKLRGALFF